MLSIDGVHTLVDVFIIKPIQTSLVSQGYFSHGIVAIVATQVKDDLLTQSIPNKHVSPFSCGGF